MPRKIGTKEKFTTLSIEQRSRDILSKNRYTGEPLYQTLYRMIRKYDKNEIKDAEFMLKEYECIMKRQKTEIDKLKAERSMILPLERFI